MNSPKNSVNAESVEEQGSTSEEVKKKRNAALLHAANLAAAAAAVVPSNKAAAPGDSNGDNPHMPAHKTTAAAAVVPNNPAKATSGSDDDSANHSSDARGQQPAQTPANTLKYASRKEIQLALDAATNSAPSASDLLESYIAILQKEIDNEKCYSISRFRQGSINVSQNPLADSRIQDDQTVGFFSRYLMTGYSIHEKIAVAKAIQNQGLGQLTLRQKDIARDGLLGNIIKAQDLNGSTYSDVTQNFAGNKSCISNNVIEPLRRAFRRI